MVVNLVGVHGGADEEEDVSGRGQDEVGDDNPQQNRRRTKLFAFADVGSRPLKNVYLSISKVKRLFINEQVLKILRKLLRKDLL